MAKIFSLRRARRLAKRLFWCPHCPASQLMIAGGLVVVVLSSGASAQNTPGGSPTHQLKPKPTPSLIAAPFLQPDPPPTPTPSPPLTPEQLPPRAPQVSWDGKQLSINSENSTLADILVAVRGRTHAVIEIPPGAAAERVAVQLGPAPAREVLTSLLSGSNFNYVIQASDTDEDAIQGVFLTPRGKADSGLTATAVASASGVRLMPGYSESSRGVVPDSQVDLGSESSGSEPSAALEAAAPAGQPVGAEATTPLSEGAQPSGDTTPAPAVSDAAPVEGATPAGIDRPSAVGAGTPPVSPAAAGQPPSSTPQMVQDLQRMYEQRRQIQINQNNPSPSK